MTPTRLLLLAALCVQPFAGYAATVTARPQKDTTIYGDSTLNDGAGSYLFAGTSGDRRTLRSLIAFDVSEIPAGSTVNAVTLTLAVTTPKAFGTTVTVRRVLADWGEGTSKASGGGGGEGVGAPATSGAATWLHRFFSTATWATPGGDFAGTTSASRAVAGTTGNAVFSGAGLVADVQAWVNNPAGNFGWILVAQNEGDAAVRFSSREGPSAPTLVIDFSPPTGGGGGGGGGGGEITARLSNLSVRTALATGQTLIVGFSVSGGNRALLVRGVGPTLGSLGVTGAMTDPRIELYDGATVVAQNDDWGNNTALSTAATSVGAFALASASRDSALLQSVDGSRTVQLKGTGAGVVLVELYDTGSGLSPRLINVSARNQVGTGDNILIFGFVIDGTGSKRVLIRGVGPTLTSAFGVSGALADPRFEVFGANSSTAVASNDNWDASLASTFSAVGAFPLAAGSRDAALVTSLTPGAYTVQVSGVNNSTGEALVEIYEVP